MSETMEGENNENNNNGNNVHSAQPSWDERVMVNLKHVFEQWKEEMPGLDVKTISSSFCLYIACIAPSMAFGAMYGKFTNNNIGEMEMVVAMIWCGILYSLLAGQPMMINGGTAPVLAFTQVLYKTSELMNVPFLTLNAWVGIWVGCYMVIASLLDFDKVISKCCSRFTDEILSFFISSIFIWNAIGSPFSEDVGVIHYLNPNHKSHNYHRDDLSYSYRNSAYLSIAVFFGTAVLSFLLWRSRSWNSFVLNQACRNVAADYAVVISIAILSLTSFASIPMEKLDFPSTFEPTFQCCDESCERNWPYDCWEQDEPIKTRSWLVDLGNFNGQTSTPLISAMLAILAFLLIFLDDGLTWHRINHPSHKLKQGDILIGLMILINSLLGLPSLVAATSRSLHHIPTFAYNSSHEATMSSSSRETRLMNLIVHLPCMATIFALDILKLVPLPVLYGIFLFVGLVPLRTNQFWKRILMLFIKPSRISTKPHTNHMKPMRMRLFTIIQLLFFTLIFAVKSIDKIAITFPLLIVLSVPFRLYVLPKLFSQEELILIDSEESIVNQWIEDNTRNNESNNDENDENNQDENDNNEDNHDNSQDDQNDEDEIVNSEQETDLEANNIQHNNEESSSPSLTKTESTDLTISDSDLSNIGESSFQEEP